MAQQHTVNRDAASVFAFCPHTQAFCETQAHQMGYFDCMLFFSDGAVNVYNISCVCELRVEHLGGMRSLCVPCSIPLWLDSSVPVRGPQGPLVS